MHCSSLEGLFLHNNRIMGKGGMLIAEKLKENKNVEILDISFNAIGGGKITADVEELVRFRDQCARTWAQCFNDNKSLIHVKCSYIRMVYNNANILDLNGYFGRLIMRINDNDSTCLELGPEKARATSLAFVCLFITIFITVYCVSYICVN